MARFERDNNGAGFAVGALAGAILGAGVALLLAPKAGAELRDDLGTSLTAMREAVARRYRDLAERAGVEIENLEERVDAAAASFEMSARDVLDAAAATARDPLGRS